MLPIQVKLTARPVSATISKIDIQGDFSACTEQVLLSIYSQAATLSTRILILECSGMEHMNSVGIARLISLLIQLRRNQQRLLACGLSVHHRHLLALTHLSDVIGLYDTEAEALHAAQALSRRGSRRAGLKMSS